MGWAGSDAPVPPRNFSQTILLMRMTLTGALTSSARRRNTASTEACTHTARARVRACVRAMVRARQRMRQMRVSRLAGGLHEQAQGGLASGTCTPKQRPAAS